MRRLHLDDVALTRKRPRPRNESFRVLDVDELQHHVPVDLLADAERDGLPRRPPAADAVDAGDRGDDEDVLPGEERGRRRVAEAVDVVVDGRVFLDVEVGLGDVGLRLVVVVGDEVLDGVPGQKLPNSLQSCAASVLLWAITSVGFCTCSAIHAIVAVFPVPVAPSSVW